MKGRRAPIVALLALSLLVAAPAGARAGRIVLVGADLENHCAQYGAMCRYLLRSVAYARADAPAPSRPVLVIERPYGNLARSIGMARLFGEPAVSAVTADPSAPDFMTLAIDTSRYSALVIGSDDHCGIGRGGDCGTLNEDATTGDSDAIMRHGPAIAAFVDAGGGVLALAGGAHADGQLAGGPDVAYATLPTPPLRRAINGPFSRGPHAVAVGITDGSGGTIDEINCGRCSSTHNAFEVAPDDPAWRVIVRAADGYARAVTTSARLRGGVLVAGLADDPAASDLTATGSPPAPPAPATPVTSPVVLATSQEILLPPPRGCVSRRRFRIRIRELGVRLGGAHVVVRGRPAAVRRTRGRLVATVDLRGLPRGRFTVAITARAENGRRLRGARRYRTCHGRMPGSIPRL